MLTITVSRLLAIFKNYVFTKVLMCFKCIKIWHSFFHIFFNKNSFVVESNPQVSFNIVLTLWLVCSTV